MMALWLTRALPYLGIGLALIGSVWWIDHRGYERATAQRDASDARMIEKLRGDLRASELRLAARMDTISEDYERQRSAISGVAATVQPVIIKEAAGEPRLSDPALGLTPGLLDAVNRARAAGACSADTAGRIACALPAATGGEGQQHR